MLTPDVIRSGHAARRAQALRDRLERAVTTTPTLSLEQRRALAAILVPELLGE